MKERMLPNIKSPNLKTQVYELLLNMIVDGKYKDNDMLPPERVLCEELGVSRTVVREAVKSLETRGILTVLHGKGIKVNPSTSHDVSNAFMLFLRRQNKEVSLKDLLEVRYSIETEIAKYAAQKAQPGDIEKLEDILGRMKLVIDKMADFVDIDLEYHLQLAYTSRNIVFITIIEALVIPLRKSREETVSPEDNVQSFEEHLAIFNAIKDRDMEGARSNMVRHLRHVEEVLRAHGKL
ncbi:MAG: FadR/GntR family transcriptional regulator [Spirochaetota bacterium]